MREGRMAKKAKQIMDALAGLVVLVAEEGVRRGVEWLAGWWRRGRTKKR